MKQELKKELSRLDAQFIEFPKIYYNNFKFIDLDSYPEIYKEIIFNIKWPDKSYCLIDEYYWEKFNIDDIEWDDPDYIYYDAFHFFGIQYIGEWKAADCPNYPFSSLGKGTSTTSTSILLLANLEPAAALGTFTAWESPIRFTDDNDLVLLADWNEYSNGTWASRYTHTATGGYKNFSAILPEDAGAEGTIITKLNGATEWRSVKNMKPHAANTYRLSTKALLS